MPYFVLFISISSLDETFFKILQTIFSSPGRSPGGAIVLPPAPALVLAAGLVLAKSLTFKFFMWWSRHCQASYPGAALLPYFVLFISISSLDETFFKILQTIFSSPGRSPGGAIVLPPAPALVLAAALVLAKSLTFKFFMWWSRHCQASYPGPMKTGRIVSWPPSVC